MLTAYRISCRTGHTEVHNTSHYCTDSKQMSSVPCSSVVSLRYDDLHVKLKVRVRLNI
jgi:hypothetical protein